MGGEPRRSPRAARDPVVDLLAVLRARPTSPGASPRPLVVEETGLYSTRSRASPVRSSWMLAAVGAGGSPHRARARRPRGGRARPALARRRARAARHRLHARASRPGRGPRGFGWDPVFRPDGEARTYGEYRRREGRLRPPWPRLATLLAGFGELNRTGSDGPAGAGERTAGERTSASRWARSASFSRTRSSRRDAAPSPCAAGGRGRRLRRAAGHGAGQAERFGCLDGDHQVEPVAVAGLDERVASRTAIPSWAAASARKRRGRADGSPSRAAGAGWHLRSAARARCRRCRRG